MIAQGCLSPSFRSSLVRCAVLAWCLVSGRIASADALERLAMERLRGTHRAVEVLKLDREEVSLPSDYADYRAVMHVHSHLSHDSRGSVEEIVKGAKAAGVRVVMFTEHPTPHYDYYRDGHRGMVDGVLLLPGAETTGLQLYPQDSLSRELDEPQALVDAARESQGQAFLCHLEERMDWELDRLTGSEIYNLHADFKDENRLIQRLSEPLGMLMLLPASRQYPQETLGALLDYPAAYLRRWDELCQKSRLTGVAANDAHHNQGLRVRRDEDGQLQLEDALGENAIDVDPDQLPALVKPLLETLKPGESQLLLDLDPYERSFRHVSTHLFLKDLTEPEVRAALEAGRAYVSFDWLGDPTGFNFQAVRGDDVYEMGSEIPAGECLLRAAAPLPGRFRLLRDGKEVHQSLGRRLEHTVSAAGIYRLEVWLNLPDGPQIWILSNPIYVRA